MAQITIIVDPPGVEPAIALSIPTLHGEDVGVVVTLATARHMLNELQTTLDTIDRRSRG